MITNSVRSGTASLGEVWRYIAAAVALVLAASTSVTTAPTTFYVATNGLDAYPCSTAQSPKTPKRTLNNAVTCLSAGRTLYIRSGTYAEALIDNVPPGTSWNSPVTVAAYPGETVTLKPNPGPGSVLHFQNKQQYIVVDRLILDGSHVTYDVVKITYGSDPAIAAHHIRIRNSELKNAPSQGLLVGGQTGYNEFINLKVHDNGRTDFHHGLYIGNDHNLIDHCAVYANAGWGMQLFGDNPSNNTVRNNSVYNNARAGARGPGIGIYGQNDLVYNNIVWGNTGGIEVSGAVNAEIYNNTLYNNGGGNGGHPGIVVGGASHTIIRNNIVFQNQNALVLGPSGVVADHNLVEVDPGFVSAVGLDFHLQRRSPAIDAGITIATVTTDADGIKRPQGQTSDIGAYEFSGGRPTAPAGVGR